MKGKGRRFFGTTIPVFLFLFLCQASFWGGASALQPPTAEQLEEYRRDGSLPERVAAAKALGNHLVSPQLVSRAKYEIQRLGLQKQGMTRQEMDKILAPPEAWKGMPTKGTVKVLALLIDFSDYPHNNTKESIEAKLFGDGDGNYPYESLRNYYRRSSYNQLDIQGNVLGWYRASNPRSQVVETDAGREALIKEALSYYEGQGHDFTPYDNDGNGIIDYFIVIWTGPQGAWASFWWGYQANFYDGSFQLEGKSLGKYSWQWEASWPQEQPQCPDNCNFKPLVTIHETGHALGLPDYYDYNVSNGPRGGVGGLDMMDANRGDHNCFSKFLLDWVTPRTYRLGGDYSENLQPSGTSPDAILIMPGAVPGNPFGEFFMIQNRYRLANDENLPADGLLIWHVDARLNGTGTNFFYDNSSTAHKLLRLMEADGLEEIENGGAADAGDYYVPGSLFGANTIPNSSRYDGTYTEIYVGGILASGNQMSLALSFPNLCLDATPLGRNIPYYGTTYGGATNFNRYGCNTWNESGPEQIFQITTIFDGDITATLKDLISTLNVFILKECEPSSCVQAGGTSAVYKNAPAGTYYIVVDGFNGGRGPFTLTVNYPIVAAQFASAKHYVIENSGSAAVKVILTHASTQEVRVDYNTSDGTAKAGSDYSTTSGTLVFSPGETEKTFAIPIIDNSKAEAKKTINLSLSNPLNAELEVPNQTILMMIDDDGEILLPNGVPLSDAMDARQRNWKYYYVDIPPGATDLVVSVTNLSGDVDLYVRQGDKPTPTNNNCAPLNSGLISESCRFGVPSAGRWWIGVNNYDTGFIEFNVTSSWTPTVQFNAGEYNVGEGAGNANITVILSGPSAKQITVNYAANAGTALPGSDYNETSGIFTFAPGETSKTFAVPIINDPLDEPDKTVNLVLSNPVNVNLFAPFQALLTVLNDDPPPAVQLSSATYNVNESGGTATITVNLSGPSGKQITVNYAAGGGTARSGRDYTAVSGTLAFSPGESSKTFSVPILDDSVVEPTETVNLILSSPVNATLGTPSQAILRILDNDHLPVVDFNKDGKADILWHHQSTGDLAVWLMDGATFKESQAFSGAPAMPDTDWKIGGMADFDGDGNIDVVWHHEKTGDVHIWFMGGVTFLRGQHVQTVSDTNWKIGGVADFNGDGQVDIVWHHQVTGEVSIGLMNGAVHVSDQSVRTVADTNWKIRGIGDFNGDGNADILWQHQLTGNLSVWFMKGPEFQSFQDISKPDDPNWKVAGVGDYDGDGRADILLHHQALGGMAIWVMDGMVLRANKLLGTVTDLNWRVAGGDEFNRKVLVGGFGNTLDDDLPWKIVGAGDFNGNGGNDILWQHQGAGQVYVWYMDHGACQGDQHVRTVDDTDWKVVGVGDFNRDGKPDILWHNRGNGLVYVWHMDGAGLLNDRYVRTVEDTNWKIVGIGDFNGDGKPDILWWHQADGRVYVWYMDGPAYLGDQYIRTVADTNWRVVGVGDFNRDGKPDILWQNITDGLVYVWYMDGVTYRSDQHIGTVGDTQWKIRGVTDLNRDGSPDILWHNQQSGDIYVWYMNGAAYIHDQYIRTVK